MSIVKKSTKCTTDSTLTLTALKKKSLTQSTCIVCEKVRDINKVDKIITREGRTSRCAVLANVTLHNYPLTIPLHCQTVQRYHTISLLGMTYGRTGTTQTRYWRHKHVHKSCYITVSSMISCPEENKPTSCLLRAQI